MAFKIILVSFCLFAATRAGLLTQHHTGYATTQHHPSVVTQVHHPIIHHTSHAVPVAVPVQVPVPVHVDHYDPHPNYNYEYAVNDLHTGDHKSHHESRHGDVVQGVYSLVEPDGSRRTVHYAADAHNGFNAVVHRTPQAHPAHVAVAAPIVTAHGHGY